MQDSASKMAAITADVRTHYVLCVYCSPHSQLRLICA